MPTLYPIQDSFVRGEISPRLHARASLDLYRAALSKCENFVTLPHGGLRKRGGTYFVGELKDSSTRARPLPFIFSSDQAYMLEVGHLYLRIYAYGARVGTVELTTPWPESALDDLQFIQSADVMWIVHGDYPPQILTREAAETWTLEEFIFNDGPYLPINTEPTTLTPASRGSLTPTMTTDLLPSGTVTALHGADPFEIFDADKSNAYTTAGGNKGWIQYQLAGGAQKVVDRYWMSSDGSQNEFQMPVSWTIEGSNDGATWVVLDSREGESGWASAETRFYEFTNTTAYEYHRIKWTGTNGSTGASRIGELGLNEAGDTQTPFNLVASSTAGINDGDGFKVEDIGRTIRLLGADNQWRWARITGWTSTTLVQIRMYGHALTTTDPIANWRMSAFDEGSNVDSVALFEERLAFARRFSVYASKTGEFDNFAISEADDAALTFLNAGGGQANDIVWLADADGFLLIATTGGIRALSGSGLDEALTPTSFKNRKSRTYGCARIAPVDAGSSFLYVTRSKRSIAELAQTAQGRFTSDDIGQVSEHIPKKGVVEIAFQTDPDPLLWFPLLNGELGAYTHQPSQEVRGMHRHRVGGVFTGSDWAIVERGIVTPGQNGVDDVWLFVKRTIDGVTKRYIEIMNAPFEYADIEDAFQVDCGLTYDGAATGTFTGLDHLEGQTVDCLASGKVYKGLTVTGGAVTLPDGATATKAHIGLPFHSSADTLELDVGGKDGSIIGRRKKVAKVILSLFETDTTGLEISSLIGTRWERVKVPTVANPTGMATLFTGNVEVPIDDSWEGQGRVRLRHTNPTPCTVRSMTPVFDFEP